MHYEQLFVDMIFHVSLNISRPNVIWSSDKAIDAICLQWHLLTLGYHCFCLAPKQEYSVVVDAIMIKIEILNYIWLGLYWPPICINEANTL